MSLYAANDIYKMAKRVWTYFSNAFFFSLLICTLLAILFSSFSFFFHLLELAVSFVGVVAVAVFFPLFSFVFVHVAA